MGKLFNGESFEGVLGMLQQCIYPRDFAGHYGYESVNKCLQDLMYFSYNCAWEEAEEDFARRTIY